MVGGSAVGGGIYGHLEQCYEEESDVPWTRQGDGVAHIGRKSVM